VSAGRLLHRGSATAGVPLRQNSSRMSATPDLMRPAARLPAPGEEFRLLIEQWACAVVLFEQHGGVYWSNSAAAAFPLQSAEALFAASPAAWSAWRYAVAGTPIATPLEVLLPDRDGVDGHWRMRLLVLTVEGARRIACLLESVVRNPEPANVADERLETALEIARSGVWEMQFATGQLAYSDGYLRMLGVKQPAGGLTADFWATHVHPDDAEAVSSAFGDYANGVSQTFECEYRMRHEDGHWVWLLDRSRTVVRDPQGRPLRVIGFAMDITARREAERALRESEERFRLAAQAVNGVTYEADLLTGATVLHGVDRLLGLDLRVDDAPDTIERWLALVHPDDRERVRMSIETTRALARSYDDLYYRVLRPDGELMHVWARGSYICDATGRAVRAVGLIENVTARVQAEEALRRSEFRFRAVADLAPGFVFEGHAGDGEDGCFAFTSEAFDAVMGCSHGEFLARGGWEAFCSPASVAGVRQALADMRRGEPVDVELNGCMPGGRETWLRLQAVPVMDTNTRRASGSIGVVHDITEAKKAELQLRESQHVLQTVIASSPTNLALYDLEHRCIFANYTLHGGPLADIVGKRIFEFTPEADHRQIKEAFDKVMSTGQALDEENEMLMPGEDRPRILETRLRPVHSDGKIVGVVTNISDVTELRSQREDLNLRVRIIETIREGVVLLDRKGRVLLANPAMHALFGYARDALVGRELRELSALSPPAFDRLLADVLRDVDAGEAPQAELEGVRADGERLVATCIFTAINIRGEDRIVAVLSDITERKRLEREMLQVVTREQQRIGSDLHDGLGQQLTGIALLLKGLVPRLARTRSTDMRGDVEQIVSLVNDAIDSTRALARGLSPVPAADDGLPLALEALATQIFDRHGVEVTIDNGLPEDQRFDDNTATHLYRIVQEALGNALRHGHPAHVTVQLQVEGGHIELTVSDDGAGFDRRATQPSGLGLKIMRFRAQMIGGDLTVESAPGVGTTIRCHCPLPRAA
jgi:PAS domain S-box-containing protein